MAHSVIKIGGQAASHQCCIDFPLDACDIPMVIPGICGSYFQFPFSLSESTNSQARDKNKNQFSPVYGWWTTGKDKSIL